MEVVILNESFETVLIIDTFKSLIWTERHNRYGEFELEVPITFEIIQNVAEDYYAYLQESERSMIIEELEISSEIESDKRLLISGRSLESILKRRIVWTRTVLNGSLQDEIERLLNENIIQPNDQSRTISNFIFERSTDPRITELTIKAQYTGDELYNVINELCEAGGIGYKIVLTDDNKLKFSLYAVDDHSYNQDGIPYVVFSPKFDNFSDSNYVESIKGLKNVAFVVGEDNGTSRKKRVVGSASGIGRREIFVDASDIQSENSDGTSISSSEYRELLEKRGSEALGQCIFTTAFEGQADLLNPSFVYNEDYKLGDIVQVENEFGMGLPAIVSEYAITQDTDGIMCYPSFVLASDVSYTGSDTTSYIPSGTNLNVISGGEPGQVLIKNSEADYDVTWTYVEVTSHYTHIQAIPASEWIIDHNLGFYPSVSVVDSAGSVVSGEINYVTLNRVVLTFAGEFSGSAYLS